MWYVIVKKTGVPVSWGCELRTTAESIVNHLLENAKTSTGESIDPDRLDVVQLSPQEAKRRSKFKKAISKGVSA